MKLRHVFTAFAATLALAFNAVAGDIKLPDYRTLKLDNGATVLLLPNREIPLVTANALVRGGALADAPGKEGTAALLAELLSKGAGKYDAKGYAEAIDNAGGSLHFGSSRETLSAGAQFLSKDSGLMLSLLADALLRPTLDPAEFDKLRKRAIDGIAAAKDGDPGNLIGAYASAWLYATHPYGRPAGGSETSLATITLDDLKAYRARQTGGDRLILVIAGDFDEAAIAAQVKQAFGGWAKATGTLPDVPAKAPESGRRVLLVDKPGATQTYFHLANIGSRRGDAAEAAQDLVQTAFGGRFTSMLNEELRVKSGLTYGARARIERPRQPGATYISTFTKTDSTKAAIDLAIATLDRLHQDGLDAATIEGDKHYISGHFAPELETAPQIAAKLAELALYGEGNEAVDGYLARIAAATPEQVNAARGVFPQSPDLVITVIGDAAKIRDVVKGYGPVTEMKISDPTFSP